MQDHGPGIAAEDLEQIFTPFRQGQRSAASRHGLGLGLAIVKEVVEAHGGQIAVDSQEGVGTIFTIRLPLLEP